MGNFYSTAVAPLEELLQKIPHYAVEFSACLYPAGTYTSAKEKVETATKELPNYSCRAIGRYKWIQVLGGTSAIIISSEPNPDFPNAEREVTGWVFTMYDRELSLTKGVTPSEGREDKFRIEMKTHHITYLGHAFLDLKKFSKIFTGKLDAAQVILELKSRLPIDIGIDFGAQPFQYMLKDLFDGVKLIGRKEYDAMEARGGSDEEFGGLYILGFGMSAQRFDLKPNAGIPEDIDVDPYILKDGELVNPVVLKQSLLTW